MSVSNKIKLLSLCLGLLLTSFAPGEDIIKVYLAGDSTMALKEKKAYPETGWGLPFSFFFNSAVKVNNHAMNGRSTKSFINEGRWDKVLDSLKEGDYVLIQFGHNDEVPTKKTYTPESEFTANLKKFIAQARQKKAYPVLITPVARRKFDINGKVEDTHKVYAQLVRMVAKETKASLIDLAEKSMDLLQAMGPNESKYLFNHLQKDQHPNYPEGKTDDTHFNELGARYMAELVLKEIKQLQLPLANYIKYPVKK